MKSKRTKVVKGWAIIDRLRDNELCCTAIQKKNLTGILPRFPVIPCTITYSLPQTKKIKKVKK